MSVELGKHSRCSVRPGHSRRGRKLVWDLCLYLSMTKQHCGGSLLVPCRHCHQARCSAGGGWGKRKARVAWALSACCSAKPNRLVGLGRERPPVALTLGKEEEMSVEKWSNLKWADKLSCFHRVIGNRYVGFFFFFAFFLFRGMSLSTCPSRPNSIGCECFYAILFE